MSGVTLAGRWRRSRGYVGLLGGSFDPPHEGHDYVGERVRKFFSFRETWWIVSWRHRWKFRVDGCSYGRRFEATRRFLDGKRGRRVCEIEKDVGACYSLETMRRLRKSFGGVGFVWVMGVDNFLELSSWYRWRDFMGEVDIVVVSRGRSDGLRLMRSKGAVYGRRGYRGFRDFGLGLGGEGIFLWTHLRVGFHPASSTELRMEKE